ncbi:MAG TPA: Hsp20/alpha crystallin family protein [Candidatus Hydrogenedentes bacterium]|nr:MAG: Spore protein SP21 [Candidatus Hydrogenedentes bacterium ADurb.Bin170]HNZ49163.1 Hsp20/alpha crystallin family protein [Candidatus Hydrogenedentota bacterium]HOD96276.1 Hsp20/alpha crystallin family protein [Candidatus Hydrogenedentota bacterium]HOH43749.1 Hsp20/alpha crystallin family protein [Candidatus Hydrogenedentota bacterium]HOR51723.1 Hsp20/alpha crystallin family protein [Candidatus Hydrogenedentota bacterium]
MTHIFWEPFQQLQAIRNEMERVFEQYTPSSRAYARSAFLPSLGARRYPLVNIREDQDKIYVEALAPGLNPGSIEVSVLRDQLRLSGEKAAINPDVKAEAWHRNERGAGRFVREISLPAEVDGDKVTAAYKNGLLLLTLPKHEAAKPRQISVQVS